MAPVLSGDPVIAKSQEQSGAKTTDWVAKHAPNALPLLHQARVAVSAEATAKPAAEGDARSAAEAFLFAILNQRPLTRNRFRLNVLLDFHFGTRLAEGDLVATDARLVIEVDGYFTSADKRRTVVTVARCCATGTCVVCDSFPRRRCGLRCPKCR